MVENGPNDLIPNRILAFARPKWCILVHFGLKKSILVHLGPPTVLWPFLSSLTLAELFPSKVLDTLNKLKSGFLKRALAQTCFRAGYQVQFLRRIFGHSWGLAYGEGGRPWYGTSAQPESLHMFFTKRCPSGGTEYVS